jgi:hypothetical protein
MKSTICALTIILLFAALTATAQNKWTLGAMAEDGTELYHKDARRAGEVITYWEKDVRPDGSSMVYHAQTDCASDNYRTRIGAAIEYGPDHRVLDRMPNDEWTAWRVMVPETTGEGFAILLCRSSVEAFTPPAKPVRQPRAPSPPPLIGN